MLDFNHKNPTKELLLFWPHECPDILVGMDKPPKNWFFNSWMTPKTMMLVRKNKYVGLQQQKPNEGTDVVLAT